MTAGIAIFPATKERSKMLTKSVLVCEDGNYCELYREKIEWTDFPLNKIELWSENGVLMLASEH